MQYNKINGNAAKVVLRGYFREIQVYLKKQEKYQTNNFTLHLNLLEKEEQAKPKLNIGKVIIEISVEINVLETKRKV